MCGIHSETPLLFSFPFAVCCLLASFPSCFLPLTTPLYRSKSLRFHIAYDSGHVQHLSPDLPRRPRLPRSLFETKSYSALFNRFSFVTFFFYLYIFPVYVHLLSSLLLFFPSSLTQPQHQRQQPLFGGIGARSNVNVRHLRLVLFFCVNRRSSCCGGNNHSIDTPTTACVPPSKHPAPPSATKEPALSR